MSSEPGCLRAPHTESAFPYIYRWHRMDRKDQRLRVLARGKMNSVLVEFEGGYIAVTSGNALRKAKAQT
ncbi:MAG TPA: hypothetical protein VGP83_17150 [Pyrinomonadaceae bacterium]|nr:hypothetical protein [Pyrinomonadaceae bacterium]